jgi:hypothetical protein
MNANLQNKPILLVLDPVADLDKQLMTLKEADYRKYILLQFDGAAQDQDTLRHLGVKTSSSFVVLDKNANVVNSETATKLKAFLSTP